MRFRVGHPGLYLFLLVIAHLFPAAAQSKPQFAVASIRENKSNDKPTSNIPLDRTGAYVATGGIFSATNQTLVSYILFAYNVKVSETFNSFLRSLPEWAIKDKFDISARAESTNPTKSDMRLMLRSLLEDRFKLIAHRETHTTPVLALTLINPNKLGPQLKPHDTVSKCPGKPLPSFRSLPVSQTVGLWPEDCGDGAEVWVGPHLVRTGGRDISMGAIASLLTGAGDWADRPIIDATGIQGTYDVVIEFVPEYSHGATSDDLSAPSGPNLPEALETQLGLRFRKQQGSATFFSVDHIEYPTEN